MISKQKICISCIQSKFNATVKVMHEDSERDYKNHNDLEICADILYET